MCGIPQCVIWQPINANSERLLLSHFIDSADDFLLWRYDLSSCVRHKEKREHELVTVAIGMPSLLPCMPAPLRTHCRQ